MSLPGDEFHAWETGRPAGQNCSVMTNYRYWEVVKYMLGSYIWRDIQCTDNHEEIQGYICERKHSYLLLYKLLCNNNNNNNISPTVNRSPTSTIFYISSVSCTTHTAEDQP